MTLNSRIQGVLLAAFALASNGGLRHHDAQAAESIGTPIWDVSQVVSQVGKANHQRIGVYGDVIVHRNGTVTIADKIQHQKILNIDMARLDPSNSQRLLEKCHFRYCSEIFIGYLTKGGFEALMSYPFASTNQLVSPMSPASGASWNRPARDWRCDDARHCT